MTRTKFLFAFFFYFLLETQDCRVAAQNTTQANITGTTKRMGIPPPYEFPNNTKEYKFMDNNEIRNNLSSHTSNTTDTELEDLNQPTVAFPNTFPKYNGTILTNTEYMDQEEHRQQENDSKKAPFTQGRVAATLVCVFLGLSIMSYAGLLLWRKYLENKYGNREMLVNEDEFYAPDLKNFSI